VAQVGHETGIRETIIVAIEDDDFSACGGDSYAQGCIRRIAGTVGADPEPLIRGYNTARLGSPTITGDITEPATPVNVRRWRGLNWIAVLVLVWLGLAAYDLLAGLSHATSAPPLAQAYPADHRHLGRYGHAPPTLAPSPQTPTSATAPVRTLTPVRATAFGPHAGDNGDLASLAIDANPATAWHTDWYTTARFGNLYPGTGLLVDMGRPVTITAAQITLGSRHGASLQLRVGTAPALADLRPVAQAANAGGVVRLRLTTPAHGRYVLIWFTGLPPRPAGTFQASVYSLRLEDRI
jgi:hypothetical protein